MFIVIKPTEHKYNKKLIKPFLNHIKNSPRLKWFFQSYKKATFIITADEAKGIYGGTMLLKQPNTAIHKNVQKNILNCGFLYEEIWTGTLFLRKEINDLLQHDEFFFETFYRDLYRKLVEFGIKENTSFLQTILEPGDYFCTEALGCWPYIFTTKPHESLDSFYHSVLSLVNNPLQFRTGVAMGCKEIKLAA